MGTLVERTTGYLLLLHLPEGREAEKWTLACAGSSPSSVAVLRTITGGHGNEMAKARPLQRRHRRPGLLLRPAQPLPAALKREHNGLLRQYFPRGTDLTRHSRGAVNAVALALNTRPRKTLAWKTPPRLSMSSSYALPDSTVATTP